MRLRLGARKVIIIIHPVPNLIHTQSHISLPLLITPALLPFRPPPPSTTSSAFSFLLLYLLPPCPSSFLLPSPPLSSSFCFLLLNLFLLFFHFLLYFLYRLFLFFFYLAKCKPLTTHSLRLCVGERRVKWHTQCRVLSTNNHTVLNHLLNRLLLLSKPVSSMPAIRCTSKPSPHQWHHMQVPGYWHYP